MTTHEILTRQYRASLAMLEETVKECPEPLWYASEYPNRYWHVAYHVLFYTHLYLHSTEEEFRRWEKHRPDYQFLGPKPWPPHEFPKIGEPYSKPEVLEYHQVCKDQVETAVKSIDLEAPSGFSWLPFNKLELQLYNIRHLQHHTGQLIDRLRTSSNIGVRWVGTKPQS